MMAEIGQNVINVSGSGVVRRLSMARRCARREESICAIVACVLQNGVNCDCPFVACLNSVCPGYAVRTAQYSLVGQKALEFDEADEARAPRRPLAQNARTIFPSAHQEPWNEFKMCLCVCVFV